jgi:DNA repair exonuclease SbcCD ATPase subunit
MPSGKEEILKVLLERADGPGLKEKQDNLAQAREKLRVMEKKLAPAQGRERQLQSEISSLKAKRDSGDVGDGEDLSVLSRQLFEMEGELEALTSWLNNILGAKRDAPRGAYGPAFIAVQREIKEAQQNLDRTILTLTIEVKQQFEAELNAILSSARDLREAWKSAVGELLDKYGAKDRNFRPLFVEIDKFHFDWS